jgi:hypothetical protein
VGNSSTEGECESDSDNPHQFSIFDPSAWLRTCSRLPIVGARIPKKFQQYFVHMFFLNPQSKIGNRKSKMSSDDSIRPRKYVRRNRQVDLLCRLDINHQLKLRRLLRASALRQPCK